MERLTIRIPDLTCAGSVPRIEQVLRQQEGVIWAIVNFAAGEATILYDPLEFEVVQLVQTMRQLRFQVQPNGIHVPENSQNRTIARKPLARMQHWVRMLLM
jgi:cation transport ATPase